MDGRSEGEVRLRDREWLARPASPLVGRACPVPSPPAVEQDATIHRLSVEGPQDFLSGHRFDLALGNLAQSLVSNPGTLLIDQFDVLLNEPKRNDRSDARSISAPRDVGDFAGYLVMHLICANYANLARFAGSAARYSPPSLRQRMPASMKPSMSPSRIADVLPDSYSVRRSLTI